MVSSPKRWMTEHVVNFDKMISSLTLYNTKERVLDLWPKITETEVTVQH